jgi:hypothetical protein
MSITETITDVETDMSGTASNSIVIPRQQKIRKQKLMDKLESKKLQYIKNGICDAYVKYGKPEISIVVQKVTEILKLENKRKTNIMKKLLRKSIKCDDIYKVNYFREYIENDTDLNTAVTEGEKELFLLENTKYSKYLYELYDEEKAEKKALNEYTRMHRNNTEIINKIHELFGDRYTIKKTGNLSRNISRNISCKISRKISHVINK